MLRLVPFRMENRYIRPKTRIFSVENVFVGSLLPRVNGKYVSYLSDLTFLSCPSLRGLKNPSHEKGKAGTPSTLRTEKRTVWRPMFSVQWPCPSYLMYESRDTRDFIWPLDASPAPRTPHSEDYSVTYSAPALPALPTFLGCALNPCLNYYLRISFTLKLSLGTHTTAKCQGPLMMAALLILRIRILGGRRGRLICVY
jgi:hypothetical protein